jgi:hypothetical protein
MTLPVCLPLLEPRWRYAYRLCRAQAEEVTLELRQRLASAKEAQDRQERQTTELKQQLAAAHGGESQHAAEMAALATQLAVAARDLDAARDEGRLLQQRVQVGAELD